MIKQVAVIGGHDGSRHSHAGCAGRVPNASSVGLKEASSGVLPSTEPLRKCAPTAFFVRRM